jgi:hypothetical protein
MASFSAKLGTAITFFAFIVSACQASRVPTETIPSSHNSSTLAILTQSPPAQITNTPTIDPQSWQLRYVANRSGGPDGVRLFDFNKDGLMDVTTSFESSGEVVLFLHPGLESLDEEWPSVVVGSVPRGEDAFAMDVDNDGAVDIVSAHEGDTEAMYVHWAPADLTQLLTPGAWQTQLFPSTQGKAWMYAIPLDINLDGNTDIVLGAKDDYYNNRNAVGDIGWLEAPAEEKRDLNNWVYHSMGHAGWPMSIIAHDIDRDGDQDILLTDRNSDDDHMGARWLENPGNNWEREWISHFHNGLKGSRPGFMGEGDFNNDGVMDYTFSLWSENQLAILEGGSNQLIVLGWPGLSTGKPKGNEVGDLDLDGKLDIVVTFEKGEVGVGWMNYTVSPFADDWTWNPILDIHDGKFDQAILYDVDQDGDLDVLTTEEVQGLGVIWFENPTIESNS